MNARKDSGRGSSESKRDSWWRKIAFRKQIKRFEKKVEVHEKKHKGKDVVVPKRLPKPTRPRHFCFGFGQMAAAFRKRGQRYGGKYRKKQGSKGWKEGPVLSGKSTTQHSFNPKDPKRKLV